MTMSRRLIASVAGVAVAMLAWTGPASAATSRAERFTFILYEAPEGTSCTAIASGPISGVGSCILEEQSEEVSELHVTLPNGTFGVTTTIVTDDGQFNSTACLFQFTEADTFAISGSSGAYASATGSGTAAVRGVFTLPHTAQGCDRSQERGVIVANATGTAAL